MSDLLERYKDFTEETAIYPGPNDMKLYTRVRALLYPALGLSAEAGEFLNKFKKVIRDDEGRITSARNLQLVEELGDVLWYFMRCCDALDVDPEDVIRINMRKLSDRDEREVLGGEGDRR